MSVLPTDLVLPRVYRLCGRSSQCLAAASTCQRSHKTVSASVCSPEVETRRHSVSNYLSPASTSGYYPPLTKVSLCRCCGRADTDHSPAQTVPISITCRLINQSPAQPPAPHGATCKQWIVYTQHSASDTPDLCIATVF